MTNDDRPRFVRALMALGEVYSDVLSEARMSLYFTGLSRFAIEDLEQAMGQLVAQPGRKFMPKPGEIVEVIEGLPEDRALSAWARIERASSAAGAYMSVDFRDPVIHMMIVRYGGWPDVANWFRDLDSQALGYKRHQFLQEYKMAERLSVVPAGQVALDHLPGIFEIQNSQSRHGWERGDLLHQDVVAVLGPTGEPVTQRALPAPRPVGALLEAIEQTSIDAKKLVADTVKGLETQDDIQRERLKKERAARKDGKEIRLT